MASGRPGGSGFPHFTGNAKRLLDNGYAPIPIRPESKVPAVSRWSSVAIDAAQIDGWVRSHSACGIGLRTGCLIGLDIDLTDPDPAHAVFALAERRLGATVMRVGCWPKRMLLYRSVTPFAKMKIPGVEVLGAGQQFVAFGIHPDTAGQYYWPLGESPLDVPLSGLPEVDVEVMEAFLGEAKALVPARRPTIHTTDRSTKGAPDARIPVRDASGRVTDGRDAWLSSIAFHKAHDALDAEDTADLPRIAGAVWLRFCETTNLERAKGSGEGRYGYGDALAKVRDKLRLNADGRLPARDFAGIEADYVAPTRTVDEARLALEHAIADACRQILTWHSEEEPASAPRIGLRATVGLGKSRIVRRHLVTLQSRLRAQSLPHRMVIFVPSHGLAQEAALALRDAGAQVAVQRGYFARHPASKHPMCRDPEAVRAAINAGLGPHRSVCIASGDVKCPHFSSCLKQENRAEVAAADIVLAPYDTLFTGFAIETDSVAALVVDESCWARALETDSFNTVESLDAGGALALGLAHRRDRQAAQMADLLEDVDRLRQACLTCAGGPVTRQALAAAGIDADTCDRVATALHRPAEDPGLVPGLSGIDRDAVFARVDHAAHQRRQLRVWETLRAMLRGSSDSDGRVCVRAPDAKTGQHRIVVTRSREIHPNLAGKPLLHLDATLRPDIAGRLLPGLETREFQSAAPNMQARLVTGSFGKTAIVPDARLSESEQRRRVRNLAACVDYVHWQALRYRPGRVLVITYKDVEQAFATISGVDTGHFNAIAGLDQFRQVSALIIIGRPIPPDTALAPFCAGFEGHVPDGGYRQTATAVRMRDGTSRAVRVMRHSDAIAEWFRSAICDDELVQAIGRGRGVNRSARDPLHVHVLANVALPLVHDRLLAWDTVAPDILQRMLLAGIAVDSPSDAAVLHPKVFANEKQAQKAFERAGFKRQFPISSIYRGMSLKSACYRRQGRGQSRQRAWWIDGDADAARSIVEAVLGPVAEWKPQLP